MRNYVIFTDSACDLSPELLNEWGVRCIPLTFNFNGDNREYSNYDMEPKAFYDKMREGGVAKTSAINTEVFISNFKGALDEGLDIIYVGFSSGLSTTFNCSRMAKDSLTSEYPDSKIEVVDGLSASAGQGLLVRLAVDKKNSGATVEELSAYVKEIVPNICHWFSVDDLVYLKRGGRISAAAAFFGNVIGIKPVLHVDDEGHLVNVMKIRGRKGAIQAMAAKYDEFAENKSDGIVYISHADCLADAESLASMLKEKHGVSVELITDIGPVIGAHAGPGTLALFFVGSKR